MATLVFGSTMNKADIVSAIASISRRGAKLDADIHLTACSIAAHINVHHEVSLVNQLIDAMPNGSRVNALREWFVTFAKCVYNDDAKAFEPMRSDALDLTTALVTPWYEFKPEAPFKVEELSLATLGKYIANFTKADASGDDRHKIDADLLAKLQELVVPKLELAA